MKTENKLLACDLVEFLYRYPELDFWLALKEFEKRKNPKKEEVIHDVPITDEKNGDD